MQTLTTLDLQDNNVGDDGGRHLIEALKVSQVMWFPWSTLHLHALRPLQTLITLDLQRNDIGTDGARHVAETLKVNQVMHQKRSWTRDI